MEKRKKPIVAMTLKDLSAEFSNLNASGQHDPTQVMPIFSSTEEQSKDYNLKSYEEYQTLSKKSANKLMESGEMAIVKEKYPELYKIKIAELKDEVNGNVFPLK